MTARHGLEQNREVLAVPGPVSSTRSQGCHLLIQQGAKLLQNIDDLLQELSPMYGEAVGPDPGSAIEIPMDPFDGATGDEATLLRLLDEVEPIQLDELAEQVPFGIARLNAALFGLELRGAIETFPGHRYCRRAGQPGAWPGTSRRDGREAAP